MKEIAEVARLIEPALEAMGYDLVRVKLYGEGRPRLQVMVERNDGGAMTVDDCAELSRAISTLLDVEDPVSGSYVLEVSSPGIDRPLVKIEDFERFAGFEARIETARPIAGRRRFRGTLLGVSQDRVKIALAEGAVEVPHREIAAAKLVISDALIEAGASQRKV